LRRAGHVPVVFDDLSTGLRDNLAPGTELFVGSILNPDDLKAAAAAHRFDGVIHLAALKAAGESMTEPEKYSRHNITGSLNLLEAVVEAKIPSVVFSSTAAVYGAPDYLPIDEKHPTRPENYYGYTKLAIEGFIEWYARLRGFHYGILRYFNAAGYDPEGEITGLEKNPGNLLPVVMEAAMGWRPQVQVFGDDYETRDGTGLRDYVHVTDLASAHVAALEKLDRDRSDFIVNLGTGDGITVREMIQRARVLTGRPIPEQGVPRRLGDAAAVLASSEKAFELLGWKARHSDLDSLLTSTWKAYLANQK